jgi:hypothetical protein
MKDAETDRLEYEERQSKKAKRDRLSRALSESEKRMVGSEIPGRCVSVCVSGVGGSLYVRVWVCVYSTLHGSNYTMQCSTQFAILTVLCYALYPVFSAFCMLHCM